MARTLDVGTTTHLYNRRITATEADLIATYSDWATVGQDLWTAINTYPHGGIVSAN